MPKPYRVKRNGKLIGSFLVVIDGQRVNLETKDANEARRRARLAERGKWPPEDAAADATKEILDGAAEPGGVAAAAEPVATTPATAEPSPSPRGPDIPPAATGSLPAVDPVAAANAAAGDLAAEACDALGMSRDEVGGAMSEMLDPAQVGQVHYWAQGQLCRFAIKRWKGKAPPLAAGMPPEGSKVVAFVGKMWIAQLSRWNINLEALTPLGAILLVSTFTAVQQFGAMLEAIGEGAEQPEPQAGT